MNSETGSGAITALRIFRLSRILNVGKIWKDFKDLMSAIKKTMKDISNITVLVAIFVFTFMLIGLELYAYRVKFNLEHKIDLSEKGIFPKSNFNTPLNALLSVFIVIANDGWTEVYTNHARATDFISSTVFFVVILVLG